MEFHGLWRNVHPENDGDTVTINSVVTHSTDYQVGTGKYFEFDICHVRGFHGKGFMAQIKDSDTHLLRCNCSLIYGTHTDAYAEAVRQGREQLQKLDEEEDAVMTKEIRESITRAKGE